MTAGSIILVALCYSFLGVLLGLRLGTWRRERRSKRRMAARVALDQQLHQLRAARQQAAPVQPVRLRDRRAA